MEKREGLPAAGRCAALALCAPDIPALQPFPIGRGHFVTHRHSGGVGLAEREGFEPSVPLRVHMISNHAH